MKFNIELVPKSNWYKNVRSEVTKEEWNILRKNCYRKANYTCEICGGKGTEWPVECHEIWEYNDRKHIQKLIGLISLCPDCHKLKHIGRTQIMGEYDLAINHFMKVNNITRKEAENEIKKAVVIWNKRNKYSWILDLDFITHIPKP